MKKTATTAPSEPTFCFAGALSHEPADRRMEILRLIGHSGSISQAARQAGVSYKAAWQAIDTLTNLAGTMLVQRAVGGAGGGGAKITPAGIELLSVADLLVESRQQVLALFQASRSLKTLASPAYSQISVRTSMRNQLPCRVEQLDAKGQTVRVHLTLAEGQTEGCQLLSRITKASAELLGLKKGQSVLALCKATAVSVAAVRPGAADKKFNLLRGRVVRVDRGASGDEVSMQLDSGLHLVGFAKAASGLRVRSHAGALIDEAAVVIALAG